MLQFLFADGRSAQEAANEPGQNTWGGTGKVESLNSERLTVQTRAWRPLKKLASLLRKSRRHTATLGYAVCAEQWQLKAHLRKIKAHGGEGNELGMR